MHEQLRDRLAGIRQILIAHHAAGSLLPNASKGAEREALIREFLEKVFPFPYRFGSGAVIDSAGLVSGQLDVVVEWPFCASLPTLGGSERLYLAESVAFVVEVKSDLMAQWPQVEASVAKLRPVMRRWRSHLTVDPELGISTNPASQSRIPCAVVGFSGYETSGALAQRLKNTPEDKRPDVALVLKSGAYVGWGNLEAIGDEGLFAFMCDGAYFVRNVITVEPDLKKYLKNQAEAG
jgi:hypothetical protein